MMTKKTTKKTSKRHTAQIKGAQVRTGANPPKLAGLISHGRRLGSRLAVARHPGTRGRVCDLVIESCFAILLASAALAGGRPTARDLVLLGVPALLLVAGAVGGRCQWQQRPLGLLLLAFPYMLAYSRADAETLRIINMAESHVLISIPALVITVATSAWLAKHLFRGDSKAPHTGNHIAPFVIAGGFVSVFAWIMYVVLFESYHLGHEGVTRLWSSIFGLVFVLVLVSQSANTSMRYRRLSVYVILGVAGMWLRMALVNLQ